MQRSARHLLAAIVLAVLAAGCAKAFQRIDGTAGTLADGLAPPDPVTGGRRLQLLPESWEVEKGEKAAASMLAECRRGGIAVRSGAGLPHRLARIFRNVTAVSHLPGMPWQLFLLNVPEPNANTPGGGKVFVYDGLFGKIVNPRSDDEIAAVLAHEIAHVTCRHIREQTSWQIASLFSKSLEKRFTRDAWFRSSFSTAQEEEADRVGLLYMALAGYNPRVVEGLWMRAHRKYGSAPGNFTYSHPLKIDRARRAAALSRIAADYYVGREVRNPKYKELLVANKLVPRASKEPKYGVSKLAEALASSYLEYYQAKEEAEAREKAHKRQQAQQTPRPCAWLGIGIGPLSDKAKRALGIGCGIVVRRVARGSPAHRAGIRPGDILAGYNGQKIPDPHAFLRLLAGSQAGATVPVVLVRSRKVRVVKVTLGARQ